MELNIWNNEPRFIRCINKYSTPTDTRNWERLEVGKTYYLTDLDVGSWYTDIYLKEFEGLSFNSVLFEEIKND